MIIIDFETRSRADLKKVGTDMYCNDPSTEIICMAAAMADPLDTRQWLWFPEKGQLLFSPLLKALGTDMNYVAAHHARFDQGIWEYIGVPDHGFPKLAQNRWYCTSAQARVNALPAGLDDATQALNSKHKKSHAGQQLIKKLCIPQPDGSFNMDPTLLNEMYAYCMADVQATKDLINSCRLLSPEEHEDWLVNERINDRGIKVDLPLAKCASQYADAETIQIALELAKLTQGAVTKHTQNQRIKKWMLPLVNREVEKLTVVYKNGERKNSLAKDIRANLLDRADAGDIELADEVYNVIACLDEGNMSSVAKFKRMIDMSEPATHRVHGAFMYAGAGTLRYTSRGLQVHNFKRDCYSPEDSSSMRNMMLGGGKLADGTVMQTLGKLLRPAIIPATGKVLIVGDWASIEGRGLPFLANDHRANQKLELFKQIDNDPSLPDMYERADHNRQVGKVKELALGYGGAGGAFRSMARNYGVYLPSAEIDRAVKDWRRRNDWAPDFWNKLERAARLAIQNPLVEYTAGLVAYTYVPDLIEGTLMCKLPGDHWIQYPKARVERVQTDYGMKWQISALKANWGFNKDSGEWSRFTLWRGLLAENVTQAFCAALLRWALRFIDHVVLHCHDEIVLEVPATEAQYWQSELQKVMEDGPLWAIGLPLKAPAKIMTRYGK